MIFNQILLHVIILNTMKKNISGRREFLKYSSVALGGLPFIPLTVTAKNKIKKYDETKLNIICIGAHPGDPEFGCGGTMARYSDAGHNVTFIYLTRGEGWAGDPALSHAEAAGLRTKEAETACKILNAKPVFAGQIDGETELNNTTTGSLEKLLMSYKPDIVFTQWPVDTHPDHQVTGCITLSAWQKSGQSFDLYFYEVDTGSETMGFYPTDYVDITGVHDRKMLAMIAHKTQGPEKIYEKDFKAMESFRGIEAGVGLAEAFVHFKPKSERAALRGL
jgi:LmbE family N-acetylglucosaminyl deacetylase